MKLSKLLFLLTLFSLTTSNIFSQPARINELMKRHADYPTHQLIEKTLSRESILNSMQNSNSKINTFETTEVVDSAIVTYSDGTIGAKHTYTNDSNGNMTSHLMENWDGTNWVIYWRETYTYNSNENMTSYLSEYWDGTNWVNPRRETYTYNFNGNMTSHLWEYWDGTNWVNDSRDTYTYDPNGNRTSRLIEYWDGANWVNSSRDTYTNDSNGNVTSFLSDTWDGTNWVNVWLGTYTYDSNGNMTSYLSKNGHGTNLTNFRRNTYTNDSNGNRTSHLMEKWRDSSWVNSGRNTYMYDSNGNRTLHLLEIWDGANWVNYSRYTSTNDSNGNRTLYFEVWSSTHWLLGNANLDFSDTFGNSYSFYGAQVELFYKTITNVEDKTIEIGSYSLSQNYPNPFNPSTTIRYTIPQNGLVQIEVYDMLGQGVAILINKEQARGNYEVEFNAENLPSGVYFYKLQSGNFTKTKKLILLK